MTHELISEIETDPQTLKTDAVAKREGGREGMDGEFGVSRYKLLHTEGIKNRSSSLAQGTIFNVLC